VRSTVSAQEEVELVFYVDEDDQDTLAAVNDVQGLAVVGPRIILAECWNRCAEAASGEILGQMGDDIIFHTGDWDVLLTSTFALFEDRICFVYGRDGVHDQRLGTHGFVHRRWIEAVGYFTPPYFSHDYCDAWLNDVAWLIDRKIYRATLYTEHLHPDVGKATSDRTLQEHAEAGKRDNVTALYQKLEPLRLEDADKLREVMS
jgi:hypothetical protein